MLTEEEGIANELAIAEGVAAERGWILNPRADVARNVARLLYLQRTKTGIPFCPCKPQQRGEMVIVEGQQVHRTRCPCVDSADEIAATGHCCCKLYFSPDWDQSETGEE